MFTICLFIFLIILLDNPLVINSVCILVSDYFYTFRYCYYYTLYSLTIMINNYLLFLKKLTEMLTTYPNNLICCITSTILLYIVYLILKLFKFP